VIGIERRVDLALVVEPAVLAAKEHEWKLIGVIGHFQRQHAPGDDESEILKSVSLIDLPIAQPQLVLADSAARRGRLSAMPLKPLRTGAAHVVQLRSITVHENAHDFSADSQEEHPRTPPH
jgi:hypothetical protein